MIVPYWDRITNWSLKKPAESNEEKMPKTLPHTPIIIINNIKNIPDFFLMDEL